MNGQMQPEKEMDEEQMDRQMIKEEDKPMMGGKKKRKEPSVLASWRKFVRKVQHEEKITYPQAMKRASKRKSEWQRGGADMEDEQMEENDEQMGGSADAVQDFDGNYKQLSKVGGRRSKRRSRRQRGGIASMYTPPQSGGIASPYSPASVGGSRRRRGTKKRRGSRRR